MNTDITLSIVVISFNTIEMTRECLNSVINNSANLSYEIIVVDNNSHDGSVEMIRNEFPDAFLIANKDNKGFAAANNQAFDVVKGKYILLLNSDTIVLGDVLAKSVTYLIKKTNVAAMGCRVLNSDKSTQKTCSGYPTLLRLALLTTGLDRMIPYFDTYLLRNWDRNTEREVEVISGCYLLVREDVISEIGYLDDDFFFFGEETDWCLRMRKAGHLLMFSPIGEIIHHGGGSIKKLNHKRDLMLTEATVKLHKKNSGTISAAFVFLILLIFNISRALFWSFCSLFKKSCRQRARHFLNVLYDSSSTWPKA